MDLREPPQFSSTHLEDGSSVELHREKRNMRQSERFPPNTLTPAHSLRGPKLHWGWTVCPKE